MKQEDNGASTSGPGCEPAASAADGVFAQSHPSRRWRVAGWLLQFAMVVGAVIVWGRVQYHEGFREGANRVVCVIGMVLGDRPSALHTRACHDTNSTLAEQDGNRLSNMMENENGR